MTSLNFFHNQRIARVLNALTPQRFTHFASLAHGSREPLAPAGIPVWATPTVLSGGFASGECAAALSGDDTSSRAFLMSADHMRELTNAYFTGDYRLAAPENGALLVVAALLAANAEAEAGNPTSAQGNHVSTDISTHNEQLLADLLRTLEPHMDTLRFYPHPAPSAAAGAAPPSSSSSAAAAAAATAATAGGRSGAGGLPALDAAAGGGASLLFLQPVLDTMDQLAARNRLNARRPYRLSLKICNATWLTEALALQLRAVQLVESTFGLEEDGSTSGGFPFQRGCTASEADAPWWDEARSLVAAFDALVARHVDSNQYCSKRLREASTLAVIVDALRPCLDARTTRGGAMPAKTVGLIRNRIAGCRARYGATHVARAERAVRLERAVPRFTSEIAASAVASRLQSYVERRGAVAATTSIESVEPFVQPAITEDELRAATAALNIPPQVAALLVQRQQQQPLRVAEAPQVVMTLLRCTEMSLAEMIDVRVVRSVQQVARVCEALVAQTIASSTLGHLPMEARRLATQLILAFRRRRSLLLLTMASQVRVEELPWYSALIKMRSASELSQEQQQQQGGGGGGGFAASQIGAELIREIVMLLLAKMPAQAWDNKLVSSLNLVSRATAPKDAGVRVAAAPTPWISELAADIFVGGFSASFERSARLAAGLFGGNGSLYARYYGVNYDALLLRPDDGGAAAAAAALRNSGRGRGRGGFAPTPGSLAPRLDAARFQLNEKYMEWSNSSNNYILNNRRAIEAVAIITTHNLAQFVVMCCGSVAAADGSVTIDDAAVAAMFPPRLVLHIGEQCLRRLLSLRLAACEAGRIFFRNVKNAAVCFRTIVVVLSLLERGGNKEDAVAVVKRLQQTATQLVAKRRGALAKSSSGSKAALHFVEHRLMPFFAFALEHFGGGGGDKNNGFYDGLPITAWFEPPPGTSNALRRDRVQ